jgi:hypothetical protein
MKVVFDREPIKAHRCPSADRIRIQNSAFEAIFHRAEPLRLWSRSMNRNRRPPASRSIHRKTDSDPDESKVVVPIRSLKESEAIIGGRQGKPDIAQNFVLGQSCGQIPEEEFSRWDLASPGRAFDGHACVERQRHRGQFCASIGMRKSSANRPAVANRAGTEKWHRRGQERAARPYEIGVLDGGLPRHGADNKMCVGPPQLP